MAEILTNNKNYYDIADTIRQMKNVNTTYKPREMASALKDIYSNEVEGVPPLSFEANGNNLLNYRIDGASGGVGDRTGNLVDKTKFVYGYRLSNIGTLYTTPSEQNLFAVSEFIEVNSGEQYIISQRDTTRGYARRISFYQSKNENSWLSNNDDSDLIFTVPNTATYLRFTTLQNYIDSIMLIRGTSLLTTYEPYGYKVPVVISGKNLLPTPEVKSQTESGVTISRFANGIITIKGTPTAQMDVKFNFEESTFSAGSYIHLRNNFSTYNFAVSFRKDGVSKIAPSLGKLNSIQRITEDITVNQMVVLCNNNAIGTNYDITIQPSIELTNEDDTYEPYHEPTTTNIYLDNPIRTINDEVEYIDYSEQKQHRVRKNLLQNTATTQTINGVTFTVNNDKSITCNGTSSATTTFAISIELNSNINYVLSGSPKNGGVETYRLDLRNISYSVYNNTVDNGDGINFTIEENGTYLVCIRIASGYTCNNLTFYPMIRKADIEDDTYEPYIENTEVDVTLPAIPTIDGTNVITIDTTVQPSNVYIQAPKDTPKMIEARERLEVI